MLMSVTNDVGGCLGNLSCHVNVVCTLTMMCSAYCNHGLVLSQVRFGGVPLEAQMQAPLDARVQHIVGHLKALQVSFKDWKGRNVVVMLVWIVLVYIVRLP